MGVEYALVMYADDPGFLPTKDQLRAVASVFLDAAIIDEAEYRRLDASIDRFYPDNPEPVEVRCDGDDDDPDTFDAFEYAPTGTGSFPGFRITYLEASDDPGAIIPLQLELHKAPECMRPAGRTPFDARDVQSRFVIAMIQVNSEMAPARGWWGKQEPDIDSETGNLVNPEIQALVSRLGDVLGVRVAAELSAQ
jgi:hypothetical protein